MRLVAIALSLLCAAGATAALPQAGDVYDPAVMLGYYDSLYAHYQAAGITSQWQDVTEFVPVFNVTNYLTAVRTNRDVFLPFAEAGGRTNMARLSARGWDQLEANLLALPPYYLQYWRADGTSFETWLRTPGTNGTLPGLPAGNLAAFCDHAGIGSVGNLTTDEWGVVTGGRAELLTEVPMTGAWALAEMTWGTNGWTFQNLSSFGTVYRGTAKPVLRYYRTETNAGGNVSVTITGVVVSVTNAAYLPGWSWSTQVTVSVAASTTVALANYWLSVDSMTSTVAAAQTGDCVALIYTNFAFYLDDTCFLQAEMLAERFKLLDEMRWTAAEVATINNTQCLWRSDDTYFPSDWATALAQAQAATPTNYSGIAVAWTHGEAALEATWTNYYAEAWGGVETHRAVTAGGAGFPSGVTNAVDFYAAVVPVGMFDNQGVSAASTNLTLWDTQTGSGTDVLSATFGSLTQPPAWPGDPTPPAWSNIIYGTNIGWRAHNRIGVARWDVDGGLKKMAE